jgi:hypothetical protein
MSDTEAEQTPQSVALERAIAAVTPGIEDGTITWDKLAAALRPEPAIEVAPARVAVVRVISDAVKAKIAKLPEVFAKVTPDTVRVLEPAEVEALLVERDTMDDIVTELGARKEDIRTTVLNSFDAKIIEERCLAEDGNGLLCYQKKHEEGDHAYQFVPRTKDGHFAPETEGSKWTDHGEGKTGEQFSWERKSNSKADISVPELERLANDEEFEFISHKEYLSMTTQVRVFDPNKAMLAIKKNPKLIVAVAEATRPGSVSAALNIRKIG